MNEKVLEKLLQQSQEITNKMLDDQRKYFDKMLSGQTTGDSPSNGVPLFHAFNKQVHKWESYLEQLEQHFTAYSVQPGKYKAFFLTWIGTETYEILRNNFGAIEIEGKTFMELTQFLTDFFHAKVHVVAARHEFHIATMQAGQTYKEWIADLRRIARDCKFVCSGQNCTNDYTEEMIRDKIIVHTPHDTVRAAALQKTSPTLAEVIQIADIFEATERTITKIKDKEHPVVLNAVKTQSQNKNKNSSKKKEQGKNNFSKSCSGCGTKHNRKNCKFRNAVCNKCGKKGHIAVVCMSSSVSKNNNNNNNSDQQKDENSMHNNVSQVDSILSIHNQPHRDNKKVFIDVFVNNTKITFQMDSGATVSVLTQDAYEKLAEPKLRPCQRQLYDYGKNRVHTLGEFCAELKCGKTTKTATLVVARVSNGHNLFGTDLFDLFGFEICQIAEINDDPRIDDLLTKYKSVFEPALGTIKQVKASVHLKSNAVPKFCKTRQIPFAQMEKFKAEVQRLTDNGIWKPIKFSEWASPIVLVTKPDGSLRICGDFKTTVNKQIDVDQYPLPTRQSLLHTVRYGKYFSKIDLKDAYLQMELDEEAKKILVVNTPVGLFQYQRLPYGIASAPAMFQKFLEQLIQGIEGCGNYLDDIIVASSTVDDHILRLGKIFSLLEGSGIRCKQTKCEFLKNKLEYLGRTISASGILPDKKGVQAVKDLPRPQSLKEAEAFLGKVNYYHNFIPNFSEVAAPINQLRRKNVKFEWGSRQEEAFIALKNHIIDATELSHFQEHLPIVLATDASSYGIGAVISHRLQDGSERPIAFASKTLNTHQVRYSQIEKEALSIIFGVQRFHQYLFGHKFILITDHKPLVSIFSPGKNLPTMSTHRLQRWAITLMSYQFDIQYRKTSEHSNADALSRLPCGPDPEFDKQEDCHQVETSDSPIDVEILLKHYKEDPLLHRVKTLISCGWPTHLSQEDMDLMPFFRRRYALTVQNDLIYFQTDATRIVIPASLRQSVLNLLHEGHWGIVRMKQLARQHCWWHQIDDDIEKLAAQCSNCQIAGTNPNRQYQEWPKAEHPWQRVHIDFAGPIFNSMWLVAVDAYSQFPFVVQLEKTTTLDTISALSTIFALEGLPETLVSDNGPQLTATTFAEFCVRNGIKHIKTAPFHPASNGLAERFVRTFKTSVQKNLDDGLSLSMAVAKYLSTYRAIPNAERKSPAELLHGRVPRTLLTILSAPKKINHDFTSKSSARFSPNETVYVKHYGRGPKWIEGIVVQSLGNMVYAASTCKGIVRRHQNQLKRRYPPLSTENHTWMMLNRSATGREEEDCLPMERAFEQRRVNESNREQSHVNEDIPRRSTRVRCQPDRYQP